ncbi:hypothetical protein G6F42_027168 [Rhizopus arrhizus]|nr:hypothetical protein G6F42_027168 [Rhizopus arrhizus]
MVYGKSPMDFQELPQLPTSVFNQQEEERRALFDQEQTRYNPVDLANEVLNYEARMNPDQRQIYDTILHSIDNPGPDAPTCFFIDGPGGTGKTYLYHAILTKV